MRSASMAHHSGILSPNKVGKKTLFAYFIYVHCVQQCHYSARVSPYKFHCNLLEAKLYKHNIILTHAQSIFVCRWKVYRQQMTLRTPVLIRRTHAHTRVNWTIERFIVVLARCVDMAVTVSCISMDIYCFYYIAIFAISFKALLLYQTVVVHMIVMDSHNWT